MIKSENNRLVILAGPSCVGKSPLARALARFRPELSEKLKPLILYNSRDARPGESDGVDYHFRSRKYIEGLKKADRYIVMKVRGDIQALDIEELSQTLRTGNVFFEGNPFIGNILLAHAALSSVDKLSVFMAPLSRDEIVFLQQAERIASLPDLVTDIMRMKLLRRTQKQKGKLSENDLEDIEKRASSAYTELHDAHRYQYIIPNHDGEDSENWETFYYPLGDARLALNAFISLLENRTPKGTETWEENLLP
jgi:guanylate kinase